MNVDGVLHLFGAPRVGEAPVPAPAQQPQRSQAGLFLAVGIGAVGVGLFYLVQRQNADQAKEARRLELELEELEHAERAALHAELPHPERVYVVPDVGAVATYPHRFGGPRAM